LFRIELKQKFENCSGKLCVGILIIPNIGAYFFASFYGKIRSPAIKLVPFLSKCLSNIILFIVFANSKLTSLKRAVVSEELFPLSCLVFYVIFKILLTSSLSISGI